MQAIRDRDVAAEVIGVSLFHYKVGAFVVSSGYAAAAGALYAWGVLLTPALGAVLMSASTVIVAINARLLSMNVGEPPKGRATP